MLALCRTIACAARAQHTRTPCQTCRAFGAKCSCRRASQLRRLCRRTIDRKRAHVRAIQRRHHIDSRRTKINSTFSMILGQCATPTQRPCTPPLLNCRSCLPHHAVLYCRESLGHRHFDTNVAIDSFFFFFFFFLEAKRDQRRMAFKKRLIFFQNSKFRIKNSASVV
jgi:hypothetical protein